MRFLIRIIVIAAVSFGLAHVLKGVHIDTFWTAIVFAVVLAILNIFIKPLIILLTLPVTILTLGLFLFIINALVVALASKFVHGITIDSFWWALLFSLILSFVTSILERELDKDKRRAVL
jgi:putative membrane protein